MPDTENENPNKSVSTAQSTDPSTTVTADRKEETTLSYLTARHFSGPLPPPDVLREYATLIPDSPQRILELWEKEVESRHQLERAEVRYAERGQLFAFVTTLLIIGVGGVAIWLGYSLIGLAAILSPLATIVTAFIYREIKQRGAKLSTQSPSGENQ